MALYGVDVHDGYQAGLSFPTLVQQGYAFAAVKLTQGTGFARDLGDDWIRGARAAGLIPGAYHWLTAGNGAAQARWFHQHLTTVGGPDGLLIQLDCEDNASYADVLAWRDEWNQLTGGHPFLLYTGAWWWGPRGWNGVTITPYLWTSHYLAADVDTIQDSPAAFGAQVPTSWWTPSYGGWPTATILQFTSQGDAGGLGNNVDLNIYRGTREQLLTLTRPAQEDDMALSDEEHGHFMALIWRVEALINNRPVVAGGPLKGEVNQLAVALAAANDDPITPAQLAELVAAVKAGAEQGAAEALDGATATTVIHTP